MPRIKTEDMEKKTPGRKKTKDRQQKTLYIDRKHLNRMQGVNRSDVVNVALSEYYDKVDHEERRKDVSWNRYKQIEEERLKNL